MSPRQRLDVLLVERQLAESREQAQRLIRSGKVKVGGRISDKPGVAIDIAAAVEILAPASRFVSRGGEKLQGALDAFPVSPQDCTCLDLGASTGGFTDCLLQAGAQRVYAVDVGRAQLHEKLRADDRVIVLEEVNARALTRDLIPEPITFCTGDLSFISLLKVMPAAVGLLNKGANAILLVKPQFEAGPRHVRRGGVVTDPAVHRQVLQDVLQGLAALALAPKDIMLSPLRGPAGNREYLVWLVKGIDIRDQTDTMENEQATLAPQMVATIDRTVEMAFSDKKVDE